MLLLLWLLRCMVALAVVDAAVYFTKSAEEGAQTQIYLSASDKLALSDSGK